MFASISRSVVSFGERGKHTPLSKMEVQHKKETTQELEQKEQASLVIETINHNEHGLNIMDLIQHNGLDRNLVISSVEFTALQVKRIGTLSGCTHLLDEMRGGTALIDTFTIKASTSQRRLRFMGWDTTGL